MSLFTEAQVQFILADYAAVDATGKLNVIGGGVSFVGSAGQGQPTAPFTVAVTALVPAKYVNQTYVLTVELHDVTIGKTVMIPTDGGQQQALRAQQAVTVSPVHVPPGMAVPADAMQGTTIVMQFSNGLPLTPSHSYEWKVQIDGQHREGWWHRFHVLGPAPGPVFGGPAGPTTIPGVGQYTADPSQPSPGSGDDEDSTDNT